MMTSKKKSKLTAPKMQAWHEEEPRRTPEDVLMARLRSATRRVKARRVETLDTAPEALTYYTTRCAKQQERAAAGPARPR